MLDLSMSTLNLGELQNINPLKCNEVETLLGFFRYFFIGAPLTL